ncbi:1-phosphofructokinase [Geodermatophilus telluris]|uniref:1-phosphofructokinase n=1 Tax=Geodermatophilus telluris TaxID=1190417 RepID=A0A1G6JKE9_9ACTN|nr:1-phosphofructokinase family hexose kinase [Geodermatophilus telluris]SDC19193.1 1-phosphofructokinase [Geodermatophilus telluris]
MSRGRVVTLTANPSLDRTLVLPGELARGGVVRLGTSSTEPGGKGVNVARVLAAAGTDVTAVVPAEDADPLVTALRALRLPLVTVGTGAPVRTNYTLTEPDGTTTKLNEPGTPLDAGTRAALTTALAAAAEGAAWVVLSGSLPPGTPADWYADLVRAVRGSGARVAVDTSEAPLLALLAAGPDAAPDLVKPNAEELAQVAGTTEAALLADPAALSAAVRGLHDGGIAEVLLTLGGDGATLSTADGEVWSARPPRTTVRSTVGAGDSSLAGHVLADLAGAPAAERLRRAVATGAAAAALPGSALPTPDQVDLAGVSAQPGLPGSVPPAPPAAPPAQQPVPAAGRDVP